MRISVGSDHAGLPLKEIIVAWLDDAGHEVVDFGVKSTERVDYPDFIAPAARAVASGDCRFGFVFGGSGTGEQIVANKIRGIRCVQATEPVTARLSREHNDANMMAMGSRLVGWLVGVACVEAFLAAEFEAGRHVARIEKISALENER
jgi:ribose 5-phosphate isomerase B